MKSNNQDISQLKWSEEVELETSEELVEEASNHQKEAGGDSEGVTKESRKAIDGTQAESDEPSTGKDSSDTPDKATTGKKISGGAIAKTAAEFFLALMICLSLFVFSVALIAKYTLTTNYTISRIPKNYTYRLFNDVEVKLHDYTRPTGLDLSVLDGVVTQEQLEIDFNSCVRNPYPGSGFSLDTSGVEEKLNQNVINYLEEIVRDQTAEETALDKDNLAKVPINGGEDSGEDEAYSIGELAADGTVVLHDDTLVAVDEYVKEIGDLYRKNVRLPGLDYLAGIGEEYSAKFIFALIIPILVAAFCGFLLIRIQMDGTKSLRYISYATGGTAAMAVLGPLFVLIQGFYRHLGITPDYFNEFMVNYINGVIVQFFVAAAFWLVATAALTILVMGMERRGKKRE